MSVGPPLSASGPSLASIGAAVVPIWSPFTPSTRPGQWDPSPTRLYPSEIDASRCRRRRSRVRTTCRIRVVVDVAGDDRVAEHDGAVGRQIPPAPLPLGPCQARFSVTVLLRRLSVPPLVKMPPAP